MKVTFTIIGICLVFLSFKSNPPAIVNKAFSEKYPSGTKIEWARESAHEWEANFWMNNIEYNALFNDKGEWLDTEETIANASLPKDIQAVLKIKYTSYELEKSEQILNNKGETYYEVELKKGLVSKEVVFNKDGSVRK